MSIPTLLRAPARTVPRTSSGHALSGLLAASVALALSACASTAGLEPTGHVRDAASVQAGATLKAAPVSPAAWPAADWWRQLNDHQLDKLIDEALRSNPDLDVADARVRQAAAQAGLANAQRLPTVTGSFGPTGLRLPGNVLPPPLGGTFSTSYAGYVHAAVPFDLWGGKRAAWEAAVGQQHALEVDQQAARLMLSTDVTRAYARLGYAFRVEDIARNDLQRARHLYDLTRQRVTAGLDSQAQLRQAETGMATAQQKLAQAAQAVTLGRVALTLLLGQGPDRGLSIDRPGDLKPIQLQVPEDLPANLVGRRPDLVAARWRVESAGRSIDSAKAEFYPNVNLNLFVGLASTDITKLISAKSLLEVVAPAISLPLFDADRRRNDLSLRDADYDVAVAQYNKTLLTAFNQVATQVQTIRGLQLQVDAQQQAVKSAREAFDLATLRYEKGVGSYLEALTYQQVLLNAESVLAGIQDQQLDASIQLVQALGGGYREQQARAPQAGDKTQG